MGRSSWAASVQHGDGPVDGFFEAVVAGEVVGEGRVGVIEAGGQFGEEPAQLLAAVSTMIHAARRALVLASL